MPRLIDYAGRFEFIRQAAFAVVLDESVDALSRRRVAAELGTGVNTIRRSVAGWVDLVMLAADQVVSRRRRGRLGRRRDDDAIGAVRSLVRAVMPEDETHLDEEVVWLKLVAACALVTSGLQPPGTVRRDFGIAQRGYDDPTEDQTDEQTDEHQPSRRPGPQTQEDRRKALASFVEERDQALRSIVGHVFGLLELPDPAEDRVHLMIAVLEGLTLAACRGRLTPEQATELAIAYALAQRDGSPATEEDAVAAPTRDDQDPPG